MIEEKMQSAIESDREQARRKTARKQKENRMDADRQSNYVSSGSQHSSRMQNAVLDHAKVLSSSKHPIIRICLTGGPCAGKTTALATLNQKMNELGFRVLIVPEAATMLMKGGVFIQTPKMTFADSVKFQINIMRTQMNLEDIFVEIALNSEIKTVILCDRGVMDGSAYIDDHIW